MKVDTHGSKEEEWIGFDLDGTLAKYDGWKGIEHIGDPVDTMVIIAKLLHRIGKKIKVLTARVAPRDDGEGGDKAKKYVEAWCRKNLGFVPEITYEKDASMAALFDDRAVAVEQNTGKVLGGWPDFLPKASDNAKKAVLGMTEKNAEEDGIATLIGDRDGKSIYRLDYDFSKAKDLRDKIRKYMTRSTLRKLLQWPSGSGGGFADRVGNEGYAIHIDNSGKYNKTDAERKFVELHELGHIVNGHSDEKHALGHGPKKEEREEEANKYVLDNAPQEMLDDIKKIIADRFGTHLTEKNAGIKSPEDLDRLYSTLKYRVLNANTNRPFSNTKFETFNNWHLLSPEQIKKHRIGICYDTAAMTDKVLTDLGVEHRNYFAHSENANGWENDPTHAFNVYKDKHGNWRWLEGSWGKFKGNDWKDKSRKSLVKRIVMALAKESGQRQIVHEVAGFPATGTSMRDWYKEMLRMPVKDTEKKADAHHPDFYRIVKKLKDEYGIDLSHMRMKWSRHPRYINGKRSYEFADDETVGSHSSNSTIYINPNLRPVMKRFGISGKVSDLRRIAIAHELSHELHSRWSDSYNPEFVEKMTDEAKKKGFRTAYTDTVSERDFDKELFAEYMAHLLNNGVSLDVEKKADVDLESMARKHYPEDGSHGWSHIQDVLESAKRMRRRELLKKELAAIMYHDSSLMTGPRETHAEDSANIAKKELAGVFSRRQLSDIVNAIAHHRASYTGKRTSRLEDLVSAADRPVPNILKQVLRSWKYHEELGEPEDERARNVASHLREKYGKKGYAYFNAPKLYTKTYGDDLKKVMNDFDALTPESVLSMVMGAEKRAEEDKVVPNKWPEYKVWMKEHKDKSVEKVRDIIRAYYRQLGDWGVKNSKGRILGGKEIIRRNGDLDDIVIRVADEVSRSKRVNCHEMAARILDLLKKNGIVARRVMLDPENIGGVNMGHSTVFFKDNGGRWHRATGGMKAGKKSRLGDFDSIDDAVRQYIALGRKNGEFPSKDDINVFDTTDSEFSDSMSWPDYLAVARNSKKLYPVKDRHEKIAASRPSKEDLWRMYDIMQADAKLSGKVSGLGFGRNGDALRRAAIKLKVKELVNVLRDGKRIRNRIAHTPGYIPSEQDAGRALRQYADADRKISEIISK